MTNDPEALARALERMGCYADVVPMELAPAQASAWVVNPFGTGVAAEKFSTHPPVVERTAQLRIRHSEGRRHEARFPEENVEMEPR
jgi:heat shock protein HtpX